jgi:hypothetical protein
MSGTLRVVRAACACPRTSCKKTSRDDQAEGTAVGGGGGKCSVVLQLADKKLRCGKGGGDVAGRWEGECETRLRT